jgi:hypothetical protein
MPCARALVWLPIALAAVSHSAAQGAAADVAHVEAVSGRVVASSQGKPALLDVLDTVADQTRLDLMPDSELRICHHRMRKLVVMKGPLRASVSASNITLENGKAVAPSAETCAAPVLSTFQGGVMSRNIAVATTPVALRPSIKVVNRGSKAIRKIALWDDARRTILTTFDRNVARPTLENAKSYLLVVELGDGSELTRILQANEAIRTGPLFLVVR